MARGPRSAMAMPTHENTRMRSTPIPVPKSQRAIDQRVLTTIPAGFITPLVAFPLLREDALTSCRLTFGLELYETVDLLANPVLLNVRAYVVPWLAFERFNGSIDTLNRSYKGEAEPGGSTVVPWFHSSTGVIGPQGAANNEVLFHLGCHQQPGTPYSWAYNEAYNVIVGHRYVNRSPELRASVPSSYQSKLYPAMWRHPDLGHIVPDFDQASLDGEVQLTITNPVLPVRGLGLMNTVATQAATNAVVRESGRYPATTTYAGAYYSNSAAPNHLVIAKEPGAATGGANWPAIYSELSADGVHVSLSDINTAQRARAFAALRKAYAGYDDEYIKDLLMSGIRLPSEAEKQPILLANIMTQFGQGKRFSTDSADLTASVSSGAASVVMNLRCPAMNTGGVVMVTAELYPEQLWERRADPFLNGIDPTKPGDVQLPEYVRDTLDPEKVDVVSCGYVDVRHSTPTATFGYEPLNAKWQSFPPRVGGKFYRPDVDLPADEDRARIWASETVDPKLSKDFYLVTNLNLKPFVVTDQDPCEVLVRGRAIITGNTVFGLPLIEGGDEYDTVMEEADMDRIDKVDVGLVDELEPLPAEDVPPASSEV